MYYVLDNSLFPQTCIKYLTFAWNTILPWQVQHFWNKSYNFLLWISLFWKFSTFLKIIGVLSVKEVAKVIPYSTFLVSQIRRRIKYSTFGVVYHKYAYKYSTAVVSWIRTFWSSLSPSLAGTRCERERERERERALGAWVLPHVGALHKLFLCCCCCYDSLLRFMQ